MNIADEVKHDFEIAITKIDFSNYNPNSKEFIDALNIGKMWRLLTKLDEKELIVTENKIEEEDCNNSDEISEKLSKSKKYLQKYLDSNDNNFKAMAIDELSHVEILLKKAYSRLPNAEEKSKLKNYEYEHSEILKQLSN